MVADTPGMEAAAHKIPYNLASVRNMAKRRSVGLLARITSKGQITVPKAVRERLGAKEGDTLFFSIFGDEVTVRRITPHDELPPIEVPPEKRGKSWEEIREAMDEIDRANRSDSL